MSWMIAEYECPVHGRFDAMVERRADGSAPDEVKCEETVWVEASSVFEQEPGYTYAEMSFTCDEPSPWVISAPLGRVKPGEVTQGKVRKSEKASWTDTEPLAEGMSMSEWKKRRAKVWRDYRYAHNKRDDRKGMA